MSHSITDDQTRHCLHLFPVSFPPKRSPSNAVIVPRMDLAPANHEQRKADIAVYEAYGYGTKIIGRVEHERFGIEERDGKRVVLEGTFVAFARSPSAVRTAVHIRRTTRVPDLSIERAAELIRSVFFHRHTAHYYCDHIAEIVVHDPASDTSHTIPFDRC